MTFSGFRRALGSTKEVSERLTPVCAVPSGGHNQTGFLIKLPLSQSVPSSLEPTVSLPTLAPLISPTLCFHPACIGAFHDSLPD